SVLCLIFLQGCLLDRLVESKKQLCSKNNKKIRLKSEKGLSVVFDQPVLFDSDIIKILGAKPTKSNTIGNELYFEYVATRKEDNARKTYDIPVTFIFSNEEGQYKLNEAQTNRNIKEFLSYELLNQVLNSGCNAKLKGETVEVNLANIDLTLLPKLKKIKELLGEPHHNNGNTYTYYYELNSSDTAKILVFYDKKRDRMSSVKIAYFRYVLDVDFDKLIAIGKVKNWYNMVALGFWVAFSP
ncbi:hypothetical protein KA005_32360, partial [bacterium]|nr:hypothetical protein [bacterium]